MVGKLPLGIMHQIERVDLNFNFVEHRMQINNQIFDILVALMNGLSLHSDIMRIFQPDGDYRKQSGSNFDRVNFVICKCHVRTHARSRSEVHMQLSKFRR